MIGPTGKRLALRGLLDGLHVDPARRGRNLASLTPDAWASVIRLANDHLLAPALGSSLADVCKDGALPDDVCGYLDLLRRSNGRRNDAIRRQALELLAALNRRGIRPLLLKGALALFADGDRDPAARMMADIDIAVPAAQRHGAEDVLGALGYGAAHRYPEGHHAVGEFERAGDPAPVDLHLELIDQRYILPIDGVFERAHRVEIQGVAFLVPDATDRILHVLLHAQIHHLGNFYRGRVALGQLHDFATIVAEHGRNANWTVIDGCMREHRLTAALDSYLVAARDLFGLGWPLDRPPGRTGQRHARLCRLQLFLPGLGAIVVPAGNLRAAFAWHRMRAGYGGHGGLLNWQTRHTWQYLRRHNVRQALARLLR